MEEVPKFTFSFVNSWNNTMKNGKMYWLKIWLRKKRNFQINTGRKTNFHSEVEEISHKWQNTYSINSKQEMAKEN